MISWSWWRVKYEPSWTRPTSELIGSISTKAAGWLDGAEVVEIEIENGLQRFSGWRAAACGKLSSQVAYSACRAQFGDGGVQLLRPRSDRGDALVIERADLDGTAGDLLSAFRIDVAQQAHDAHAGAEALLGCGRLASRARISPSVFGPTERPQRWKRSGVRSA